MVYELTKKICGTYGPSGREKTIAKVIENEIKDYVDEVYTDNLGNLIAHKKGTGKKIMVSTHMDSIGLAITFIDDNGFLRFGPVGGIPKHDIVNLQVKFENGTRGVVSYPNDKPYNDITILDFYIDIGATTKEEALKMVQVGDFAVYCSEYFEQNGVISGPYMDDRIACVVSILAIKKAKKSNNDIYYVFSTQEEVGLRGAGVAAYHVEPDFGLAIDVTGSSDTPGNNSKTNMKMGHGPCVKIKDGSVICNEEVKEVLYQASKNLKMDVQDEVLIFGGTDTAAMQLSRGGTPSGAISISTRYIHSPQEMVSVKDVEQTVDLLVEALTLFK